MPSPSRNQFGSLFVTFLLPAFASLLHSVLTVPLPASGGGEGVASAAAAEAGSHLKAAGVHGLISRLPLPLQMALSGTGFVPAFTQSFLLILACELGDRTFFVAALLAMKSSRFVVWSGALAALALMTIVSAVIGKAFPLLVDRKYTSIAAAALFLFFGLQLLHDWWRMRGQAEEPSDELAEVEKELAGDGGKRQPGVRAPNLILALFSPVFVKSFSMTALAEWGDRSQIATIALAAAQDIYGVTIGAIIGHALCTSLAVVGGRLLASRISERAVALLGGVLFVCFAVLTASGKLE